MKLSPFALAFTLCLPSCFPSSLAATPPPASNPVPNPYGGPTYLTQQRHAAAAAAAAAAAVAVTAAATQNNNNNNDDDGRVDELNYVDEGTEKGYNSAIKLWNTDFAPNQGYAKVDHLTKEFVCGEVLQNGSLLNQNDPPIRKPLSEFANFLLQVKQTSGEKDGKHYSVGTILQYLSGVKTFLFKKFKELSYFGVTPDWWSDLYNSLRCRAAVAAISRGESVTRKAVGLSRKALINCCRWLMRQEDQRLGYEERCILVTLYHAVGRGGEVSTSAWNNAEWNVDHEFLSLKWGEVKNGQQPEMTFHPDTKEWMLDIFHALACYLIAGHGKAKATTSSAATDSIHWMFPSYVDMVKGGAANKASRIIGKCRDNGVEGVVKGVNSHGIRVTATDDMTFHHLLSVFATIARGGWDFKSDNLAFYYFTKKLNVVMAGKVLAGWHDPRQKVHAPTLDAFVTNANKSKVDQFCARLFAATGVPYLSDELKGFRDAMVASLLMYYEDVERDLGSGSLIIETMNEAALRCNISDSNKAALVTLSDWGKAVRARFIAANAKNLGDVDLTEKERQAKSIELLQQIAMQNLDNNKELNAELGGLRSDVSNMMSDMSKMMSMMHQLCMTGSEPTSSPRVTNKRSRTESPSPSQSNSITDVAEQSEADPPLSVMDALKQGALVAKHVNFNGCGAWNCRKFIASCILSRQDVDNSSRTNLWLGKIDAKQRAKIKRLYLALRNRATDDQRKYFKASCYPLREAELTEWAEDVTRFVPHLANDFIDEMLQRMHPNEFQKKKKTRSEGLLAIEKLMRDWEKYQGDNDAWEVLGVLA